MLATGHSYEAACATVNRKWPISSGANAISGQAARCVGGPGLQMTVRSNVIVPVYLPVHQGFEPDSPTLTRWLVSAGRSLTAIRLVQDRLLAPRLATDAISQVRSPLEEPIATGVVNRTVNVVVGVPREGVTATGVCSPSASVACATAAPPATLSAARTIVIPSRFLIRRSVGLALTAAPVTLHLWSSWDD
jgi:hypothetical protein